MRTSSKLTQLALMAAAVGVSLPSMLPEQKELPIKTQADLDRIAAAEAKRKRRAEKKK